MQIRSILLLLIMLPALLLPEGLAFSLCRCDVMRASSSRSACCAAMVPVVKACCTKPAATSSSENRNGAALVAGCNGCQRISLPNERIWQSEATHTELFAAAMPFIALARVHVVEPPRFECSLRLSGARFKAPPDRARSLPLLI